MPSSTHSHISASCNAVSVFLENAILSKNEGTRRLVHSRQTWMTIFDVFRDRFDDGKSKSMRQVLVSLVKVLKHDGTDAQFIRSQFVDAIIPSIFLRGTRSQLKASLVSIEVFTRRNAILPTELISLFDNWLVKNPKLWTPLFQDDCNALSIDISQYINGDRGGSQNGRAMQVAATIFVLGLASWGKSMDSASTAGSALAVFFESNLRLEDAEAQNLSSAWVTPVRHVMLQNMGSLEAMSNQVLYPLFKIDPHGFNCFINTLPFESSFAGDVVDAPLPELILLFSALQTGKKIGIVHEDCQLILIVYPLLRRTLLTLSQILARKPVCRTSLSF